MNKQIINWAIRHQVSAQALHELGALFGVHGGHTLPDKVKGVDEDAVQSVVRLEASRKGAMLFRNNVGVLEDKTGRPVRYGLANDSKELNKTIKSADLIGFRSTLIEQHHVGSHMAQFVSRECKKVGWSYKGDEREAAQLAWAQLVIAHGGDAAFCTGEGTL